MTCNLLTLNSSPHRTEADLLIHITYTQRSRFGAPAKRASEQPFAKGIVATIFALLDFLFGCHHVHLSRVFTLQGESYKVCCDCGARFAYSLETMSIESRLPVVPVLNRFRVA